ncbi:MULTISPECIES: PTS sugar transporter subunit IIA [Sporosarcina]|uniref:PTS system fructose-specific IIA component n=1 Tax=Sporosarcina psychrophila TaxID=1476 RepID=A0ABV2K5B2_SPOPS|nr:PTS sugar transporter subunit IIA [Sporosarcina sp. resist]
MNNLIQPSFIQLNVNATSQSEVFKTIADVAVQNGIATSAQEVVEGLHVREQQSTTGFQDGFAIPHTHAEAIVKPAIVIVRTENGVEWESFDDQPAFFFLSLLIPKTAAGTTHLKALASLSRMLMNEDKRQGLLDAKTNESLAELIGNTLTESGGN